MAVIAHLQCAFDLSVLMRWRFLFGIVRISRDTRLVAQMPSGSGGTNEAASLLRLQRLKRWVITKDY